MGSDGLGISQIGVVTVPVYPTISEEDYVYILIIPKSNIVLFPMPNFTKN
jgi:long-subunit acyl-CoA synthetase (AMP-forming)